MNAKELALFQARLDIQEGGCWLWRGWLSESGYGDFQVDGKKTRAHRASYEHHVGQIPAGLVIDHLCRVRHCVRPEHLEAVTQSVNVRRGLSVQLKERCLNGHSMAEHARTSTNPKTGWISRICRACDRARKKRTYIPRNAMPSLVEES